MNSRYEPLAGESITTTANRMVMLAFTTETTVRAVFNNIELVAEFGTTAEQIVNEYNRTRKRRHDEYVSSPEGQKAAAEAEVRAKERAEKLEDSNRQARTIRIDTKGDVMKQYKDGGKLADQGTGPFRLKDRDGWAKTVEVNKDPYGSCIIRYAARWANLMEQKIEAGAKLEQIADADSHEADVEGITGFMYGAAVSILSKVWIHGEELRRWHNLATQMGHEGEKANESGGVLNPAIINIEPKE